MVADSYRFACILTGKENLHCMSAHGLDDIFLTRLQIKNMENAGKSVLCCHSYRQSYVTDTFLYIAKVSHEFTSYISLTFHPVV